MRRIVPPMLMVIANPYASVCALTGAPTGAVPFEGSRDSYVGAIPDVALMARTKRWGFQFMVAEVAVPDSAYYRRRLAEGALLGRCEAAGRLSPFGRSLGPVTDAWEARRGSLGFEAGPVPIVTSP